MVDDLDILSASFAADFTKLLNGPQSHHSRHQSRYHASDNGSFNAGASQGRHQNRKTRPGSMKVRGDQDVSRLKIDEDDDQLLLRSSSASKNINKDISLIEIKEVDENSPRRLKKRRKALEQARKHKERTAKLKKAQAVASKKFIRDRPKRQQTHNNYDGLTSDFVSQTTQDLNWTQNAPRIFLQANSDSSDQVDPLSNSFNPRKNSEMAAQMLQGGRVRRVDTHYQKKGTIMHMKKPKLNKLQTEDHSGLMAGAHQTSENQQTPFWARSKTGGIQHREDQSLQRSTTGGDQCLDDLQQPPMTQPFLQVMSATEDRSTMEHDRNDPKRTMSGELGLSQDLSQLDREHPQLDMFSQDEYIVLSEEEKRQIEFLKAVKTGKPILHNELVQMPYSPLGLTMHLNNTRESSGNINSTMRRKILQNDFKPAELQGRWLSNNTMNMHSSASEVKIECARERRLRQGFQKRIQMGGKPNNVNSDLAYDDGRQAAAQDSTSALKSLGPKLEGVLLQLPPPTVFDFKDQLRRPASAKVSHQASISRSLLHFQKIQRAKLLEAQEERQMQVRQEQQTKDLYLDYYSWGLPFRMSAAGLGPEKDYKYDDSKSEMSNMGGKESSTKAKKGKGKGKKGANKDKQDKVVLTKAEQEQQILDAINKQRRDQAISNLWPEPENKIFIGTKPKSHSAQQQSRRQRKHRMPRNMQQAQLADNFIKEQKMFNESLRLKLDSLNQQHTRSGSAGMLPLNHDLDFPGAKDAVIIEAASDQSSQRMKKNASKLSKKTNQSKTSSLINKHGNLNADLTTMLAKSVTGVSQSHKSKFHAQALNKQSSIKQLLGLQLRQQVTQKAKLVTCNVMQKTINDLKGIKHQQEYLRKMDSLKTQLAIEAIRKGLNQNNAKTQAAQKPCKQHKTFQCACMQSRARAASVKQTQKDLIPYKKRTSIYQKSQSLKKAGDYKRTWEKDPTSSKNNSTYVKEDKMLYVREPPKPLYKMIETDYDDRFVEQLNKRKQIKLYDVQDIQKELEELTEDEDEIKDFSKELIDVWNIKRKIKQSLKRHFEPPATTLDMFKIGRVLGKGAYGKVNIAMQKLSTKLCAVKSINISKVSNENAIRRITTEKEILKDLRHPSIVKLYECIQDESHGYELMFMELCTGGDLLAYLRRRRRLDENIAKLFMKQLILALGYLHEKGVVHRDIKLENILLSNLGHIKLCDFGVSEILKEIDPALRQEQLDEMNAQKEQMNSELSYSAPTEPSKYETIKDCCGTPAYMAPEVIKTGDEQRKIKDYERKMAKWQKNKDSKKPVKVNVTVEGYGKECDVWSAGVLLYSLVYGVMPFRGVTVREIKEKIIKSDEDGKTAPFKDFVSQECQQLIKSMLTYNPKKRITVEQILEHSWFKDVPNQSDVTIFNVNERTLMIKEYFFTENPEKWEDFIEVHKDELEDLIRFSTSYLKTQESGQIVELKNVSSCSAILAPNNSSQDSDRDWRMDLPPDIKEAYKYEEIKFTPLARRADIKYEQDHNVNVDKGVYTDVVDFKKLAVITGTKDIDEQDYQKRLEKIKKELAEVKEVELNNELEQQNTFAKGVAASAKAQDWSAVDQNKNWNLEPPIIEPNNKYAVPFVARSDLFYKVSRFGYTKQSIEKSIVNNLPNHQATTYYLLEKDHEKIC